MSTPADRNPERIRQIVLVEADDSRRVVDLPLAGAPLSSPLGKPWGVQHRLSFRFAGCAYMAVGQDEAGRWIYRTQDRRRDDPGLLVRLTVNKSPICDARISSVRDLSALPRTITVGGQTFRLRTLSDDAGRPAYDLSVQPAGRGDKARLAADQRIGDICRAVRALAGRQADGRRRALDLRPVPGVGAEVRSAGG